MLAKEYLEGNEDALSSGRQRGGALAANVE